MFPMRSDLSALTAVMALLAAPMVADALAYAPNFITKTIQEQTGKVPSGEYLLSFVGDNANEFNDSSGSAASTATLTKPMTIRTRFPPEPNGYLHLGHAKAASFNFAVARMFGGFCHMRMDDTNPSKEDEEYVQSILEDVRWIQGGLPTTDADGDRADAPWAGEVRLTSDYFETIYQCAEALIQQDLAYVEELTAEEMREYRGTLTEPGKNSPYRDVRTPEENLQLFRRMRDGEFPDGKYVLRAKIDMESPNINMRDPTLYRIKHESHQSTGDKWCIYPMYDFSHPIADAVEGITHSLCTLEFEDHRPLYDWTIEKLLPTGLLAPSDESVRPQQIEFSRLNVQYVVLSKRKLIQLVTEKMVSGWDDPRMPTLSGLRRRGVPASALRLFCERVGISKADSNIAYETLDECVRDALDVTAPRAMCVLKPLLVTITNWEGDLEDFEVPRHPKDESMGSRTIPFGKQVYMEREDFFDTQGPEGQASGGRPPKGFKRLLDGGLVRLRYAYVIQCDEVVRDAETNEPIELRCTYFPDTRAGANPEGMARAKGIIHWVEKSTAASCKVNQYDRLFTTADPGSESGDYLADLNPNSLEVISDVVTDPTVVEDVEKMLADIKESGGNDATKYPGALAYQFERNGYFAVDKDTTGKENLVFNRVVTLRDTWGMKVNENSKQKSGGGERGDKQQQQQQQPVEEFQRVAFRAATILTAEPHPEAESLLVCTVDCGDEDGEPRTVVAGLAGKIPLEDLIGSKVVAVTNLKPAKMRGIESKAMLLTASDSDDTTVELLRIPDAVPNGELLFFDGKPPSVPDAMLKSKGAIKAFERVQAALRTNDAGEATWSNEENQAYRLMTSKGPVTTKTLRDASIR